jgi:hypothetical protein
MAEEVEANPTMTCPNATGRAVRGLRAKALLCAAVAM